MDGSRLTFALLSAMALGRGVAAQQDLEIRGRVCDAGGRPLAAVPVGLTSPDDAQRATTAADGTFAFRASRRFESWVRVGGARWSRVETAIPESGDVGDVTVEPAGQIAGWVRDAAGAPIAGATVVAVDALRDGTLWLDDKSHPYAPHFHAATTTDERGAFLVRGTVRDLVSVGVHAPGFESQSAFPASVGIPAEFQLQPRRGARPAADGRPRAPRVCRVRAVDDATGEELRTFRAGDYQKSGDPERDARWISLSLEDAVDGVVTLAARFDRGVEVRAPGYGRLRLDLTAGEVVARLVPESTLAGTVVDPAGGDPVRGAMVRIAPGRLTAERQPMLRRHGPVEAVTDEHGAFRIAGLGDGSWWSLVATHPARRAGPIATFRVGPGEHLEGLTLESPRGATLAVTLRGTVRDPRLRLRAVRPFGRGYSGEWERDVEGSVPVAQPTTTLRGLEDGQHQIELLVPQPPRFGGPRKVVLGVVGLVEGQESAVELDLDVVGPRPVSGTLAIHGAAPPIGRLIVAAEPQRRRTPVRYRSLFLTGPIARPQGNGSFELLAEPGTYTLLVIDAATRVVLARKDEIEIRGGGPPHDLGAIEVRSRSLPVACEGPAEAIAAVERIEVRVGELWPAGVGCIRSEPLDDADCGVGTAVRAGQPVLPIWIPTCAVELRARAEGQRGLSVVPAGADVEATVLLPVR